MLGFSHQIGLIIAVHLTGLMQKFSESNDGLLTTALSRSVLLVDLSILLVAHSLRLFSIKRFSLADNIFFYFSTDLGVVGNVFLSFFLVGVLMCAG